MGFAAEIAADIASSPQFRAEMSQLEHAHLLSEMRKSSLTDRDGALDQGILSRLLQSALIFSSAGMDDFCRIAQRISTAAFSLTQAEDQTAREIFAIIQGRLSNFPALRDGTLSELTPLRLIYEFEENRRRQTVRTPSGKELLLTQFQLDGWNTLYAQKSTALSAPTSAGKSYLLMTYLVERFRQATSANFVYIVPTRALINQVYDDANRYLTEAGISKDISVTTIPLDLRAEGAPTKTFYILTQERLEALLIAVKDLTIDVVVIDEAQMLSDGNRGVLLESVIDRILSRSPKAQFVFSGPMIENPSFFGDVFDLREFKPCTTKLSPVTQNLIYLDYAAKPKREIAVRLQVEGQTDEVARVPIEHALKTDSDRLSYVSHLFGRNGSSIVYVNGKSDAEKVSLKIADLAEADASDEIKQLIDFVKKHVHKDYALAITLKKGVGFHYGHMPSLLRKTLEEYFKARKLSFLVCTSTLLYGLNLPARNIFMRKPTTGRNVEISGSAFWNLAGRAGRLGHELEGNVYLIDYSDWKTEPVGKQREVSVSSALKEAIVDRVGDLLGFLDDEQLPSEKKPELEIACGKLVIDQRNGRLARTIARYQKPDNQGSLTLLTQRIEKISSEIDLPTEVLDRNVGVSVFRQKALYEYMVGRVKENDPSYLIPADPLAEFDEARRSYERAFKRIHTHLLGFPSGDRRQYFFAPLALRWMRGDPLPVLIDSAIAYHQKNKKPTSVAKIIRDTMENVEQHLRFRYVKFFTCYNSILELVLKRLGAADFVPLIPNVPLFLEVGGSSGAMINLMALGLSRTTAEALSEYVTNKDMNLNETRSWLRGRTFGHLDISAICVKEAEDLAKALSLTH
ncbi:DEAD/DEAH box helicase [Bradyrhizobium sp. STM 3562]|uniref:DEAD/DEAH box helicase n=1 Tax=Bradyrhizobium sp. STM 3562 TaxID=578924 RepID=UPI00388F6B82